MFKLIKQTVPPENKHLGKSENGKEALSMNGKK